MPTGGADIVLTDVLVDAAVGAGIGGVTSAVTGGNPLTGALLGGVSGGAIGGFGGPVGDSLGIGTVGGDALVGGTVGALGNVVTGGNPLTGALTGAAGGALTGAFSTPGGTPAGSPTSGGASAAGAVAPAGAAPIDLTGVNTGNFDVGGGLTAPSATNVASTLDAGSNFDVGGGLNAPSGGITTSTGINTAADLGNLNVGGANIGTTPPTAQPSILSGTQQIGGASGANLGTLTGDTGLISPPAAAGTGGAATSGKSAFNYQDSTTGKILNSLGLPQNAITEGIAKNPGALVAGGGLLFNMLQNQNLPGQDRLKQQADQLNAQGQQLANYLLQGNLPPGLQAAVDQAKQSARASIISRYAANNPSGADPRTNSALQQELAAADMQAVISTAQIGQQLLQQGVSESGLASQLYEQILNINQKQSQASGGAIANFAAALAGNGGGTTIKIGGGNS